MLTAWSTDCSSSKVINPKPSQRRRVNQGSRACDTKQDDEQYQGGHGLELGFRQSLCAAEGPWPTRGWGDNGDTHPSSRAQCGHGDRGAWEAGGHVVCSGFSETQLLPRGLQLASQLVLTAAPAVLGGTECRSYRASPGLPNAVG